MLWPAKGAHGGVETAIEADVVDAVDAGCALQGLERHGMRRLRRPRRVMGGFSLVCGTTLRAGLLELHSDGNFVW